MKLNPNDYIQKYGGKAGGYFYLKDLGGFEKHLLPCVMLYADEDAGVLRDVFGDERFSPRIVRASHPNDFSGLVDILPTIYEGVTSFEDIVDAIGKIRKAAESPVAYSYNEYEGQQYDGKVHIMIQPRNNGIRGSIVEHPHERGTYLVDFTDLDTMDIRRLDTFAYVENDSNIPRGSVRKVLNKHGEIQDAFCLSGSGYTVLDTNSLELVGMVVDLYKRFQKTAFVSEDYSAQMEFGVYNGRTNSLGLEKILFYQGRVFKKFEAPKFKLDDLIAHQCFGMTPESGIELDAVNLINRTTDVNNYPSPFAMIMKVGVSRPATFQPRNLAAFMPIGARAGSLEHNTYRWFAKAPVSVFSLDFMNALEKVKTGEKIKITSNGLYSQVEFLNKK